MMVAVETLESWLKHLKLNSWLKDLNLGVLEDSIQATSLEQVPCR
jgi:hypothetical protein